VERHIAFTAIDPGLCTEVVDFQLIGEPREVSHSVRSTRKAGVSVYREVLGAWAGVLKRVSHDTPAFGFAILVPKPDGKFRLAINPTGINKVTARDNPHGGFMPPSMIGRRRLRRAIM